MKKVALLLLLTSCLACCLAAALPAAAGDARAEEKPALGNRRQSGAGGTLVETVLPGKPLAAAPLPGGGLAILIAPEEAPDGDRRLYRVDGETSSLLAEVPKEIDSLAAWPAASAAARELWLGEPGRIFRWLPAAGGAAGRLDKILEFPGLLLAPLARAGFDPAGSLAVPGVGRLRSFTRDDAGAWQNAGELALPIHARRIGTGLEIATPATGLVELAGGRRLYLAGPQAAGPQRLRSFAIDPAAPAGEAIDELWSRLPGDDQVADSFFTAIGDRLYLVALTAQGEIFGKLALNVVPLREDRTRAGAGPSFRVETEARNWFEPEVDLRDLDGDGRAELILIEPQGMSGADLWISCWRGKGQGRFETTPLRTKLDRKDANWAWGHDLDGDLLPDLVVESEGQLLLYAGRPPSSGKILEGKPKISFKAAPLAGRVIEVSIGAGGSRAGTLDQDGAPAIWQVDGDARPEVVLLRSAGGRAVVRVLDLQ